MEYSQIYINGYIIHDLLPEPKKLTTVEGERSKDKLKGAIRSTGGDCFGILYFYCMIFVHLSAFLLMIAC